jgi:hypothetical protein
MKKVVVALAIGALALAGCSSSDNQSATQVSSSAQAQASKAAAAHAAAIAQASQQAQARAAVKAKATAKAKVAHARAVAHAKAVAHTQAVNAAEVRAHAKAVKAAKARAHRRAVAKAKATKKTRYTDGNPVANCAINQPGTGVPACTDSQIRASEKYQLKQQGASQWYIDHHPRCPLAGCSLPSDASGNPWSGPTAGQVDRITKCNNGTYSWSSKKCAGVPHPGFD